MQFDPLVKRRPLLLAALVFVIGLWIVSAPVVRAQTDGVLQINDALHDFLRLQKVLGRLPGAHLEHLPLSAGEARALLDTLHARDSLLTPYERTELRRYRSGFESPLVRGLQSVVAAAYANGRDLFALADDEYGLQINPHLYAEYGPVWGDVEPATAWRYARGIRVSGHIGRYLFFESRLTENRTKPAEYRFADRTAPRLGNVSGRGDLYDHFEAEALVGVRTRHVEVRFGRDENRWGPGIGSLLLSNYASPYEQLQVRATLGPVQLVSVMAGFSERRFQPSGDAIIPRKYAAFHRLSVQPIPSLTLSVGEAVIFSTDTLGARTGFDLSYLNPIIFFRAAERQRGSPDNVVISGSASWRMKPGWEIYASLLLDEMKVSMIGDGWWGNKWGWMIGLVAAPTDRLMLRGEFARLRPFLYSHASAGSDYIHYNDLIGHPAGPNSIDLAVFATYRIAPPFTASLHASYTAHGRNPDGVNLGGDPLESYDSREMEMGNTILQGVLERTWIVEGWMGYELMPGLSGRAAVRILARDDEEEGATTWVSPSLVLTWGMPFAPARY